MFKEKIHVGLDIGSQRIKIVEINKQRNTIQIKKYGSIDTPPHTFEGGYIIDAERLGSELSFLVDNLGLKGKNVTASVGGQQVYTRTMTMPQMSLKEIREASGYQAMNILPINIEEASMDVYPLRDFEDEEGKKTEVFFVAARRIQIDNLFDTCENAGLSLKRVEIEPLALRRVFEFQDNGVNTSEAILQVGVNRSYVALYKRNMMYSMRSIAFGMSAIYQQLQIASNTGEDILDKIDAVDPEKSYLFREILQETSRSIEYYLMQNDQEKIHRVILTGGGTRIKGLEKFLSMGLGLNVEKVRLPESIKIPSGLDVVQEEEIHYDYPLAIGLALRGSH